MWHGDGEGESKVSVSKEHVTRSADRHRGRETAVVLFALQVWISSTARKKWKKRKNISSVM